MTMFILFMRCMNAGHYIFKLARKMFCFEHMIK